MGVVSPLFTRDSDMKLFVLKILAFIVFSALVLAGLGLFMFYLEKSAYYKGLQLKPTDKYVVVGDSRSKQNINPELTKGLTNRSLGGSPWCVWFARMKDLMRLNDDGTKRVFVVEIYPRVLADARLHALRKCDYEKALLWILHNDLHEKIRFKNLYLKWFQNEFPARAVLALRSLLSGNPYPGFLDGGFGKPGQAGGYSPDELHRQSDEQEVLLADFALSDEEREELRAMAGEIREFGWDIVFVTFPTFPDPRARERDARFKTDMQEFCGEINVKYINLSFLGQDERLWLDCIHERLSGSEDVWRAFAREFNALIK